MDEVRHSQELARARAREQQIQVLEATLKSHEALKLPLPTSATATVSISGPSRNEAPIPTGGKVTQAPPPAPIRGAKPAKPTYQFTQQGLEKIQAAGMELEDAVNELACHSDERIRQFVEAGDLVVKRQRVSLLEALVPDVRQTPLHKPVPVPRNPLIWEDTDPQSRNAYECEKPIIPTRWELGLGQADTALPFLALEECIKLVRENLTDVQSLHVEWCLRYAAGKWQFHNADWEAWRDEGMPSAQELCRDARSAWPVAATPFSLIQAAIRSEGPWMRLMSPRRPTITAMPPPPPPLPQVPPAGPAQNVTPEVALLVSKLDAMINLVGLQVNAPRPRVESQAQDGGTPPDSFRRRANDFSRAMANAPKVSDASSVKDVELWEHGVSSVAITHFGEKWQEDLAKVSAVITGLQRTLSPELQRCWMEDTKADPTWLTQMAWESFRQWVTRLCVTEPINEARLARQTLINKGCQQGNQSVTDYMRAFRRLTRQVPDMCENEQIVHFQMGLNSKLYSRCRLDSAQKEFTTLDGLQNHALSIEVEQKASPSAKEPRGDYGRRAEWRDNRPPRSRGRFNKESPSLSAMEKGDKDRGGGSGYGGGKGGQGGGKNGGRDKQGGRERDKRNDQRPSAPFHPDPKADKQSSFPTQPGISNEQAMFLSNAKRCYFCFQSLEACMKGRNGAKCPKFSDNQQLKPRVIPGAPKWK